MTDKEQIEEMARELFTIKTQVYSPFTNKYDGKDKFFAIAEELYNAGYHKTVWHKVADGDLPEKYTLYLCYVHIYGFDRHRNKIDGYGYIVESFNGSFNPLNATVIAWTELPKYKE